VKETDAALRCPVCRDELSRVTDGPSRSLRCPGRHTFDVAREGYVHLAPGGTKHTGDTAEMVALRAGFLGAGHYDFLSDALAAAAEPFLATSGALVVEAGAGTAYHLARVLEAAPAAVGLALDVSKPALRRAARAHPRVAAALVDTWARWPLAEACAAVVLDVFAPRNAAEFRRVLAPGGALLVVTPQTDHLVELVTALGLLTVDPSKDERVEEGLGGAFERVSSMSLRRTLALTPEEARALARMGPSGHHRPSGTAAASAAERVAITAAVRLEVWRPRG
jgi:23S rRNA (guanine745-N1)-methyltransferase